MSATIQQDLRALTVRHELGDFLNARGLTGKGVEVGTLYGAFATDILKTWKGSLICVDLWANQSSEIYFDGANKQNMEEVWRQVCNGIGRHPRCTLYRMLSLNAVGKFEDGELDFVYLDGNHAVDAVRQDILAWWPKIKIGGLIGGHDFFTRYDKDTNSDALTAVMELCDGLGQRAPHVTWCTSWWIFKTEEADAKFITWNLSRFSSSHCSPAASQPVYSDNSGVEPVVVLPVARFDWNLANKWLAWIKIISGGKMDCPCVAWCSPELSQQQRAQLKSAGPEGLDVVVAENVKESGYFGSANQMFKGALEYCEKNFAGRAVLWAEADSVPMRERWVQEIGEEYAACRRPFLGDIVREGGVAHGTGNAVYHPRWRELAPSLAKLGNEECGWDSLCAHDIVPRMHKAKTIQQIWRPPLPITAAWAKANIRPETALFHQCKDGSLIDVLCDRIGAERIPLEPALCESTYETQKRTLCGQVGPKGSVGPDIIPQHIPIASVVSKSPPSMEIMIVTFQRDIPFLKYCLQSIEKYAKKFTGVTVVVPSHEKNLYQGLSGNYKLKFFDEPAGKGMMAHEAQICRADEHCPQAEAIFLMDADCMFWRPVTPADYAPMGRPILVRERYADIGKRNPNRLIWQDCVNRAIGFKPEWETMVRHPQIHFREVFAKTRQLVEAHTGKGFDEYVLSQKNDFPQGFAEHPALGAVAIEHFAGQYSMVDYDQGSDAKKFGLTPDRFQYLYRRDRDHMVEFWSHGGIKRYESDAIAFLNNRIPEYYMK